MRRGAVSVEWFVRCPFCRGQCIVTHPGPHLSRGLFRDPKFVLLFVGSGIATFPLLVPPFFIPLYANSVGASATLASGLLAIYNLSSAVGRVGFGFLSDFIDPISSLFLSLMINALSMLAIWPVSSSVAPLVVFIVMNGMSSGGFFSLIPSVVSSVYGNTRTANALAMTVSGWGFGYFFVSPFLHYVRLKFDLTTVYSNTGFTDSGMDFASIWWFQCGSCSVPSCNLLRWLTSGCQCRYHSWDENDVG